MAIGQGEGNTRFEIKKDKTMSPYTRMQDLKFKAAVVLERFKRETKGMAAIEFAIIAPLLIILFFGTMEVSTAVAVNRKVSRVSSTIGDLVTQSQNLTASDIADIMKSAAYVMEPYEHTVQIVVSQIEIKNSTAKVTKSCSYNGSALATGTVYPVPNSIKTDGTYLVAAKVKVTHTPVIGFFSLDSNNGLDKDTAGIDMEEEIFLRPRIGSSVAIGSC